jgi:hypothetical protein
LKDNHFFSKDSEIDFFDIIESYFLWRTDYVCKNKWCGVIHCTPKTPSYLNIVNIDNMFESKNFIESLNNCVFIITVKL